MQESKTKSQLIVEGLDLYQRGLRKIAQGERAAAQGTAAAIARLCLAETHAQNIEWLAASLPTATEAEAEKVNARMDDAKATLQAILNGGREEARHAQEFVEQFEGMLRNVLNIYQDAALKIGYAALLAAAKKTA